MNKRVRKRKAYEKKENYSKLTELLRLKLLLKEIKSIEEAENVYRKKEL